MWAMTTTTAFCFRENDGGPGVIRTRDLLHAKEAIYRADLPAHLHRRAIRYAPWNG